MKKSIDAVILAGGRGTRLSPLTLSTSKHLLPVAGIPMIVRVINQLKSCGVYSFVIVVDHRYASEYMALLKDGSDLGLDSLVYVWQDPDGAGLPTAIFGAKAAIRSDKFIVACGDVLFDSNLKLAVDDFTSQADGARIISMYAQDTAGYSAIESSSTIVDNILAKNPLVHNSGYVDLGIYMFRSDVFEKIPNLKPSKRSETEIWDLLQLYIDEGLLMTSYMNGWWADVGASIEAYTHADRHYLDA